MNKKPADFDDVIKLLGEFMNLVNDRFDKLDVTVFKQGEDIKEVQADIKEVKAKVGSMDDTLHEYLKRIEDILQENTIRDHQQQRMERWIFQLADAAGVKLTYES